MNKKQLEGIFIAAVKRANRGDVILYDERMEQVINLTEEAIRKRESYRFWKELGVWLKTTNPSSADIMKKMFAIMDRRSCFGSIKNSKASEESLELVIKEG